MADVSPSIGKELLEKVGVDDLVLSIGWHLVQGEQLSGLYAKAAEESGDAEGAAFFRSLHVGYGKMLESSSMSLSDDLLNRGRPPYK